MASQVTLVVKNLLANAGDIKDAGLIPGSLGGHGNQLQYSCLENPMDRGAWWATVHRVAQSRTRLKRLSMHTCMYICVCFSWTQRKWLSMHTCMYMCVLQWLSRVWLCDPIDPSPPDSSVRGILQVRVLERLPSPPPGEPPDPGTEPVSPASAALAASFFTTVHQESPSSYHIILISFMTSKLARVFRFDSCLPRPKNFIFQFSFCEQKTSSWFSSSWPFHLGRVLISIL